MNKYWQYTIWLKSWRSQFDARMVFVLLHMLINRALGIELLRIGWIRRNSNIFFSAAFLASAIVLYSAALVWYFACQWRCREPTTRNDYDSYLSWRIIEWWDSLPLQVAAWLERQDSRRCANTREHHCAWHANMHHGRGGLARSMERQPTWWTQVTCYR